MILLHTATVGSDETLRIWYFLGPSSAREKDIWRFLKPMVPATFSMLPSKKRMGQNDNSYTSNISNLNSNSFMKEKHYNIHSNSFGCIIR